MCVSVRVVGHIIVFDDIGHDAWPGSGVCVCDQTANVSIQIKFGIDHRMCGGGDGLGYGCMGGGQGERVTVIGLPPPRFSNTSPTAKRNNNDNNNSYRINKCLCVAIEQFNRKWNWSISVVSSEWIAGKLVKIVCLGLHGIRLMRMSFLPFIFEIGWTEGEGSGCGIPSAGWTNIGAESDRRTVVASEWYTFLSILFYISGPIFFFEMVLLIRWKALELVRWTVFIGSKIENLLDETFVGNRRKVVRFIFHKLEMDFMFIVYWICSWEINFKWTNFIVFESRVVAVALRLISAFGRWWIAFIYAESINEFIYFIK